MPRPISACRLPCGSSRPLLSALVGMVLVAVPLLPRAQALPAAAAAASGQPSAAVAEQAARQAAERILRAVQSRDANGYFALLAPNPQRVTSPSMVAKVFSGLPKLLSWKIGTIEPGLDSSSVLINLKTSAGPREVLLIVDGQGRMENFTINARDQAAEVVVREFINDLNRGNFVSASSHLSPALLEDIPQPVLQKKWLNLQLITGNFQRVKKIWQAANNSTMKLVIVTAQFNRLTDNLFVTLNDKNQIISVDFPTDPNMPASTSP